MPKRYLGLLLLLSLFLLFSLPVEAENSKPESFRKESGLTLERLLEMSLEKNPELQAMHKDSEAAAAKIPQAKALEDPEIGVRFYQVPFGKRPDKAMDVDYLISQKFSFPGKKQAEGKIAIHEHSHHLELKNKRENEILRDIKTTYFSLYAIHKQKEVLRSVQSILKTEITMAQTKLAANQAEVLEISRAQAELARLFLEDESLREKEQMLLAKLENLTGGEPLLSSLSFPSTLKIPTLNLNPSELLEISVLRNPEVKMADHKVDQKEWEIKKAKRANLPDVNTQWEYIQRPGAEENAWTGELTLNLPIYRKKYNSGVKQAEAEFASAQFFQNASRNQVQEKIRTLFARVESSRRRYALNQTTLIPQIRQMKEVIEASYRAGKTDTSGYFSALRSLMTAKKEGWDLFAEIAQASFELEETLGATLEEIQTLKHP